MNSRNKLGEFLKEVSNWQWDDFVKAEHDSTYTTNESLIFAVVRACAMEKLEAIKIALNRIDGKLKTPVRVEYPKMFFVYPHATLPKLSKQKLSTGKAQGVDKYEINIKDKEQEKEPEPQLATLSLRQTLAKMADYPRSLPNGIIQLAQQTEQSMNNKSGIPRPPEVPAVKSVIAAHLLVMAQKRNIESLAEVFDQIDGKLVETLQILGEDIYITSYSLTAPEGAYLNADGIPQVEANQTQDLWAQKLGRQQVE